MCGSVNNDVFVLNKSFLLDHTCRHNFYKCHYAVYICTDYFISFSFLHVSTENNIFYEILNLKNVIII